MITNFLVATNSFETEYEVYFFFGIQLRDDRYKLAFLTYPDFFSILLEFIV